MADKRPARRGARRRRFASVRIRTTLAAVVVVGLALAGSSVGLVWATRQAVTENLRDGAQIYGEGIARELDGGTPPADITVPDQEELFVQILTGDGQVLRSSPGLAGRPALARLADGESENIGRPTDDDTFMAVAVGTEQTGHTVLVAQSVDVLEESTQAVIGFLVLGLPLLLLLVGFVTWRVVGRTLRPVEQIRQEVDAISAAQLHRRVPGDPDGDEIARLGVTMNQMLARLEQSQVTMRQFISDASHELRSPVSTIRQYAEVALAHPDRLSTVELAETVHGEGLRVQQLIDDLLLLARTEEKAPALHPVDLDDIVFAEAKRLRTATSLRVDTSGVSAGRVLGDADSLSRVLRNLADNAARHAAGTVAFSLRELDGEVVAAVDDDGPGVPEAQRERVFDRFVRLDEARARDDGGAGLGLSIVAQVVAAHRGSVRIEENPLGGARIELRFPRVES